MVSLVRLLSALTATALVGCGARVIQVVADEDGGGDGGVDIHDASEEPGLRDAWHSFDCLPIDEIPGGFVWLGAWQYDTEAKQFVKPQTCADLPQPSGTRKISVNTFWLDRSLMPNGCYEECVVRGVCTPPEHDRADPKSYSWLDPHQADYPAYVTHEQASQFCAWRGGYLPTLAQLARAAQGDSDIPGITELTLAQIRCHEGIEADLDLCRRLGWITIPPSDPYPVMDAEYDVGPYGTRDIHGSSTEWTRSEVRPGSPEFCALKDGAPDLTSFPHEAGRSQYSTVNFAQRISDAFESPAAAFFLESYPAETVSYQLGFRCAFDEFPFDRDPGPWPGP